MKYEKEINEFIDCFCPKQEWMSEDEYNNLLNNVLETLDLSKETLSKQIQIGVDNGYSVEYQIELTKKILGFHGLFKL